MSGMSHGGGLLRACGSGQGNMAKVLTNRSFTGQRTNTTVYRLSGYTFYKDTKSRSGAVLYYRCSESRSDLKCPARAKADAETPTVLTPTSEKHCHPPSDPYYEEELRHREELINLCLRQKHMSLDRIIKSYKEK